MTAKLWCPDHVKCNVNFLTRSLLLTVHIINSTLLKHTSNALLFSTQLTPTKLEMESNSKLPVEMVAAAISKGQRRIQHGEVFLRLMAFVLTILGALLVGLDRQTWTFLLEAGGGLPPLKIEITAKYQYLSTMVFFVTANAIVCTYAAISLAFYLMSTRAKQGNKSLSHILIVTDTLIMGFLLSADGAAVGVGIIGRNGNEHLQWHKVCYMFKRYCNQGAAAVILSTFGSLCLFLLVSLSALKLHKKVNHSHVVAS